MRKKKVIVALSVVLCVVLTMTIIGIANLFAESEIQKMQDRIEKAIGDDWEKQSQTQVTNLVYTDPNGNTIIYYVCLTTYYDVETKVISGLNTDAISAVINPDEVESSQNCVISDLPAMIYQRGGRAYLCWTITPELSCVLEYDPSAVDEEDILRMAASIPANKESQNIP